MKKVLRVLVVSLACLFLVGAVSSVNAYTITNGNSSAFIDPTTQAGMSDWFIDGNDVLYQQWFWFRIGNTGPEASIDTLGLTVTQDSANKLTLSGGNNLFGLTVEYTLLGGQTGSHTADVGEVIRINNKTSSALDFHFFQYSDFDLTASSNDTVWKVNSNTVAQSGGNLFLSETGVVQQPVRWQLDYWPNTLGSLNDTDPTALISNDGPVGPGDVTWIFEWEKNIAGNGSFIISKDKLVSPPVPEPATMLLLGSGLVGLAGFGRRKFFKKG